MLYRQVQPAATTGKRVLLRVDLDVPVEPGVPVGATARLLAALVSIRAYQEAGARVVVIGHRGRPEPNDLSYTLAPIARWLLEQLPEGTATFAGLQAHGQLVAATHAMAPGDVLIVENLRLHPGERTNDPTFAKELAALGDVYVNDAFGSSHRTHASMVGVTEYLPGGIGPHVAAELQGLQPILEADRSPYVAVVGGKKIRSKMHALTALLQKADVVYVGGAIATTCFAAQGLAVGTSHMDEEELKLAAKLLASDRLHLPEDVLVQTEGGTYERRLPDQITAGDAVVDLGPDALKQMVTDVRTAQLVLWNGPLGVIEQTPSRVASDGLAHVFVDVARGNAYGVVGGGNTVGLLEDLKVQDFVDHVSTGGGAMLEYVGGQTLPALAVHAQ